MTSHTVRILGNHVAYYTSAGQGPAVVFVHGNSFSGQVFAPQFQSSLGATYRLVAPDLVGHGASAWAKNPRSAYTLPGYADFLAAFVQALSLDDAVFVGWSLGGHIVLEATAQLHQARGFMIYGTPPLGKPPDLTACFYPNPAINAIYEASPSTATCEAFVEGCFRPGYAAIPDAYVTYMKQTDPKARTLFPPSVLQDSNYTDERAIVAKLDRPLAILHALKSRRGYCHPQKSPTR